MSNQNRFQKIIELKSSFMSTTKWKQLFLLIQQLKINYSAEVKLILDDKIRDFHIPDSNDYIKSSFLEEHWGVIALKEIEWVFFSKEISYKRNNRKEVLAPRIEQQNIEQLESLLKRGKQYEYIIDEKGITIYGYK